MRASVYDWMKQTPEHEEWARLAYPLIHEVAVSSDNWNEFCRYAQGLPPAAQLRYRAEEGKWRTQFGDAWKAMGCLRETRLGQRSRGRNVYGGRTRGSLLGLGSYFRTPSYPRNVIGALGAIATEDVKALQRALNEQYLAAGHKLAVDGIIGPKTCSALHWFQYEYLGIDSAKINPQTYMALDLPARFGQDYPNICTSYYTGVYGGSPPSGGNVGGEATMKQDVKAIQTALNQQYLLPVNRLTVDGIIGPKTCAALHWYQFDKFGVDGVSIDQQVYPSLGLLSRFVGQYQNVCQKYAGRSGGSPASFPNSSVGPNAPGVEEPVIEEPPKPTSKAGIGILLGAVLGLTVIGAFVFRKKGKKRSKK